MGSVRTEEQFIQRWRFLKNSDCMSSRRKANAQAIILVPVKGICPYLMNAH